MARTVVFHEKRGARIHAANTVDMHIRLLLKIPAGRNFSAENWFVEAQPWLLTEGELWHVRHLIAPKTSPLYRVLTTICKYYTIELGKTVPMTHSTGLTDDAIRGALGAPHNYNKCLRFWDKRFGDMLEGDGNNENLILNNEDRQIIHLLRKYMRKTQMGHYYLPDKYMRNPALMKS